MAADPAATDFERRRWTRVSALLDELLEQDDPAATEDRLVALCGDDRGLQDEVRQLLAAARDAPRDLFERPLAASLPALVAGLDGATDDPFEGRSQGPVDGGRTIDRYRLLEVLGRGGMGVVYLARRADDQFDKLVALKLMPRGLETPERERRFRAERQILARLEHPGIARLLDGGVTEDGYPYLVMERVEGEPLDRFCERRSLGVRGRLELLVDVCEAVQYAHGNLVVHRDLKPANILVTPSGVVKLLDFGIAKILDDPDDEGTISAWHQPLTPDYASPEQLANRPVSTASDVYSLGVVLYRLLTGTTPRRLQRAAGEGSPGPSRSSDGPPPTPNRALEQAARLGVDGPPSPAPAGLHPDLELIVLKALEAEPGRRYVSAAALADDLRRFLDGRPVAARSPTPGYRLARFVARHRTALGLAGVAAALLVAGVAAVLGQARVAALERDRARVEADRAERVVGFVARLFDAASPSSVGAGQRSLRDLLDEGEAQLRSELRSDPAVRGKLLEVLGSAYAALGDNPRAVALVREAVADLRRAEPPDTAALASALTGLAAVQIGHGTLDGVDEALAEARALYVSAGLGESRGMARVLHLGGLLRARAGDDAGAEALLRDAIRLWRAHGAEADAASALVALAGRMDALGRADEGLALKRQALAGLVAVHGDVHPSVLATRNNIAYSLHARGRLHEAEAIYREVLEASEALLGPEHPGVADALNNLGKALMDQGRFVEAEPHVRRAAAIRGRTDDPLHASRISTEMNLASLELRLGRPDLAVALYRDGLARFERVAGPDSPAAVRCRSLLGIALHRSGDPRGAAALLRGVLDHQRAGGRPLDLADTLAGLGAALADLGRAADALPLIEEALALRGRLLAAEHWTIAEARLELAGALRALGREDAARAALATGLAVLGDRPGHDWSRERARRFGGTG